MVCLKLLLDHGAIISTTYVPCHAIRSQGSECRLLLEYGANPHVFYGVGDPPAWMVEYYSERRHRRAMLRALGAVLVARVPTRDTRRILL